MIATAIWQLDIQQQSRVKSELPCREVEGVTMNDLLMKKLQKCLYRHIFDEESLLALIL